MVIEATGNDDLIPEWQLMETHLQVKSNFESLGIPQDMNGTTVTATQESNKSRAEKKCETKKDGSKAINDKNHNTTKKVKLYPTISEKYRLSTCITSNCA